jgi:hypothetical protein
VAAWKCHIKSDFQQSFLIEHNTWNVQVGEERGEDLLWNRREHAVEEEPPVLRILFPTFDIKATFTAHMGTVTGKMRSASLSSTGSILQHAYTTCMMKRR